MAITKKPYDDTSERKLICSQGELAQAPLPQAIMGSLLVSPILLRSCGLKTVCVGSVFSEIIIALKGPVPPSSTILEVGLSCEKAEFGMLKKHTADIIKIKGIFFIV